MQPRNPIVAGQFYPADYRSCVAEIKEHLEQAATGLDLPESIVGGIVPHAGWTFSGDLAAMLFSAIRKRHRKIDTFVIFGAAHSYYGDRPAVYDKGFWETPLGRIVVDEELANAVLSNSTAFANLDVHNSEHSIEVQIPFIQYLFEGAGILPITVPPGPDAIKLAEQITSIISKNSDKKIVCVGSSDLTHYGLNYGFTPMGLGDDALKWSHDVNDRRFIDLALKLKPQEMLTSAAENSNACGAGAAAAAVAVSKRLGKTKGVLLAHTDSSEVMKEKFNSTSQDSVGYAAIVF